MIMGNAFSETRLCECPAVVYPKSNNNVSKTVVLRNLDSTKSQHFTTIGSVGSGSAKSTAGSGRRGSVKKTELQTSSSPMVLRSHVVKHKNSKLDGIKTRHRNRSIGDDVDTKIDDIGASDDNKAAFPQKQRKKKGKDLKMTLKSESGLESSSGSHVVMTSQLNFKEQLEEVSNSLDIISLTSAQDVQIEEKAEVKPAEELDLPKHVLYYGWFISTEISEDIRAVVMDLFNHCFDQVDQFQRFILSNCKDADVRGDPFEYYKKPRKRDKPDDEIKYHITGRFLGRVQNPEFQTAVHPFIGEVFQLHLIGLVFTPRTLGIRVKLTPAQQLIFDEKDEHRTGRKLSFEIPCIQNEIQKEIHNHTPKTSIKSRTSCKLKSHDKDTIKFKRIPPPPCSEPVTTSRAHITIGCAPKVLAKQTGDDLVDIIDLEQRGTGTTGSSNFQQDFKLKHGTLRQFGRHANAFVFYPDFEMIVPGTFNYFI